jgi:hypothetical protein
MMHAFVRRAALAVLVALFGLSLVPMSAQAGPLDRYSEAQLRRLLLDELEDIYLEFGEYADVEEGELEEAILDALSDHFESGHKVSDRHRKAHALLPKAYLDQEMAEAHTTLEDVVHAAVQASDRVSSTQGRRTLAMAVSLDFASQQDGGSSGDLRLASGSKKPHQVAVTGANFIARAIKSTSSGSP